LGRLRCFIALDLEPPPGPALAAWLDELRGPPELSVPPAQNLHLTLAFLGELDEDGLGRATDALAVAAPRMGAPWTVEWGATGAFPSLTRPRVLWLGLVDDAPTVSAAEVLREELAARGLPVEERQFRPHLTLARVRGALTADARLGIDALLARPMRWQMPTRAQATGVVLYQSRTGRGSAAYSRLSEARL
jgi:2'-5' RNA ligase